MVMDSMKNMCEMSTARRFILRNSQGRLRSPSLNSSCWNRILCGATPRLRPKSKADDPRPQRKSNFPL